MFPGRKRAVKMTEIFINGDVTTMDEERPQAEAFAVRDGVFTFVGTKEEARKLAGES